MPIALVTGASSGIGAEFARRLAARDHDLVLVARSRRRLDALAGELRDRYGIAADVVARDLAEPGAAAALAGEQRHRGIDVLVNSAGYGTAGRFEQIAAGRDHDQLMLNVVALVDLCRGLIPGMLGRGSGAVVNVGSTAGFQPSPYFATYAAGKTFVLNFSLALRAEYRGRGVRVLALCPGPTRTSFFDTTGERAAIGGRMMTAEAVVRAGLRGLDRDRAYVVPGLGNALGAHLNPRRPRRVVAALAKTVTRRALTDADADPGRPAP
ncbi:SDR family NAD(P)-dependent oxidoreductase [Jiangella endophytica]|uniref:SDR family NAD(P)-dependent oxidoreductase n=1 Tax=Jiangella endophytica TaxID=1623398 RepID=UPI000E3497F7|nr:SDR family oxidoreductase [Jiangella endophytica]